MHEWPSESHSDEISYFIFQTLPTVFAPPHFPLPLARQGPACMPIMCKWRGFSLSRQPCALSRRLHLLLLLNVSRPFPTLPSAFHFFLSSFFPRYISLSHICTVNVHASLVTPIFILHKRRDFYHYYIWNMRGKKKQPLRKSSKVLQKTQNM